MGHHSPGAKVIILPRKDAVLPNNSITVPSHRDRHVAEIRAKGRSEWKRQSGYYLQSHTENAFYRYKRTIGGQLSAKNAQRRETAIGCDILNQIRDMDRSLDPIFQLVLNGFFPFLQIIWATFRPDIKADGRPPPGSTQ